jgi:acetolactate synthase small subunit
MDLERWVFVVRALDKPGTLTATAAVFSHRGVSLETILGSGIASTTTEDGRLILTFRATPQKQAMLLRSLERLTSVMQVSVYPYSDPLLRSIAIVSLSNVDTVDLSALPLNVETMGSNGSGQAPDTNQLLITGNPPVVDDAIAQLREQGVLKDIVMATIAI